MEIFVRLVLEVENANIVLDWALSIIIQSVYYAEDQEDALRAEAAESCKK
jgi:hypothetical protein